MKKIFYFSFFTKFGDLPIKLKPDVSCLLAASLWFAVYKNFLELNQKRVIVREERLVSPSVPKIDRTHHHITTHPTSRIIIEHSNGFAIFDFFFILV